MYVNLGVYPVFTHGSMANNKDEKARVEHDCQQCEEFSLLRAIVSPWFVKANRWGNVLLPKSYLVQKIQ